MEYNKKPLVQATPVTNIIKSQNEFLTTLINKTDIFWQGWFECMPAGKIHVSFCGHIPIFIKDEYYLFQKIKIEQYARKGMSIINKKSSDLLKELLEEIKINRIKDEDGCNGLFYKEEKDGEFITNSSAYCYINPFIPEGYWENHILENKYK